MQVDPIKLKLKAPGTKRLKPKHHELLSNVAFKFNLRHYIKAGVDVGIECEGEKLEVTLAKPMMDRSGAGPGGRGGDGGRGGRSGGMVQGRGRAGPGGRSGGRGGAPMWAGNNNGGGRGGGGGGGGHRPGDGGYNDHGGYRSASGGGIAPRDMNMNMRANMMGGGMMMNPMMMGMGGGGGGMVPVMLPGGQAGGSLKQALDRR